jgi:hypothetical protein
MQKTYFIEEQHFTQIWLWIVLVLAMGSMIVPMIIGLYTQLVLGQAWGNQPLSNTALLWVSGIELAFVIGLFLFLVKTKLETTVKTEGLYYRFPPLIIKEKYIPIKNIESFAIRYYKPLKEYGGWGIKFGSGKIGKAYNVKGNIGMQLELKNGQKVLFGTQRADAFLHAMTKMMKDSI